MIIGDTTISKINKYDRTYKIKCSLRFTDSEKRLLNIYDDLLQKIKNIIEEYSNSMYEHTDISGIYGNLDIKTLKTDYRRIYFYTFVKQEKYNYRLVYAKRIKKAIRDIESTFDSYKESKCKYQVLHV